MTPPIRPGNLVRRIRLGLVLWALVPAITVCTERAAARPPRAEFIVAAGDSSYWVHSEDGAVSLRGSPIVLARLDSSFLELYVVDDDASYENAEFVGQRLYERDLVTGDSMEIFQDTLVHALSERYGARHPDARRLGPDEELGEEPSVSATADLTVLAVHGPFLSLEYHVDTSAENDESWHMTRHSVIDLRTGTLVTLADVLGPGEAAVVIKRARKLYAATLDSIRRDKRPLARRAAQSIAHFRFDPTSFSLTAPNGSLMVAFSAPGQGFGGEGFVLPIRPIPVTQPSWWSEARLALPTATREREEYWQHGPYTVKATYDTSARPVALALLDSAGHEFKVGAMTAPVHRIYWLDRPRLGKQARASLQKAFDEAALYEDAPRASLDGAATLRVTQVTSPR